tara:strand:+ start:45 stop:500 length:456 start_codon:yes stop_codon:yes gene_type:complete
MSGRLPNIGQDPFSQKSPFLNDLERQPKESSVIKLRKTVKAQQQISSSEPDSSKKCDADHEAKNSNCNLKDNQFEQTNAPHRIEKNNPWTLNDVMSTLSNEGIEYTYEVFENNNINITVTSKLFDPKQMQIMSQLNFGMDISGNFSKIIQF